MRKPDVANGALWPARSPATQRAGLPLATVLALGRQTRLWDALMAETAIDHGLRLTRDLDFAAFLLAEVDLGFFEGAGEAEPFRNKGFKRALATTNSRPCGLVERPANMRS